MIAPIEDVAEPPILLPTADVDYSYTVLFLVLVVGGRRMGGSLPYPLPLLLWTGVMGGGRGNLTLPLLLPMPPSVDEPLDTQIFSVVAFRGMSDPVGFNDSEPGAVEGCETATTAPPSPMPQWFWLRLRPQ